MKAGKLQSHVTISNVNINGGGKSDIDKSSQIVNKVLCFVLISIKTYAHLPMLDVVLRSLFETYNENPQSQGLHSFRYIVCIIALFLFAVVKLYIFRIFHICVPSDILPWCSPGSKLIYLTLSMKVILVSSVALDPQSTLSVVSLAILLIMLGFQAVYRIMFVPHYSKEVDFVLKSKDFLLTLIFFIGALCRLLEDQYKLDIVYFIIFSAVMSLAWTTADQLRKKYIISKIKQRGRVSNMVLEADNEYALFVMTELLNNSLENDSESNKHLGELLDLMFSHIDDCTDQFCQCNEIENYSDLLQLRQQHNQQVFALTSDQKENFNKIIDDQGMLDAISPFSDIQQKFGHGFHLLGHHQRTYQLNNSGSIVNTVNNITEEQQDESCGPQIDVSTIQQANDAPLIAKNAIQENLSAPKHKYGHSEDSQDFKSIPILASQRQVQQSSTTPLVFNIKKTQKRNKKEIIQAAEAQPFKVNIQETQQKFLAELLYLFFYDILIKFPESMQMHLFANYYSLKYRHKELLSVFQLRNFPKHKLSFLDSISYTINEQYILWEIDKIDRKSQQEENKNSSNEGKKRINGEYFIKVNTLQDDFCQVIETLGQTVIGFWQNFQRPDLNVLYSIDTASKIATYTRKVFEVFKELDDIRTFKDYHIYFQLSMVQLHLLNDPLGYENYIGKMKSILEMNQIYHKNFQSSSQQNLENSNFLIVDGNGNRFGRIIQINKGLRELLGWYENDYQLYTINDLMPTLIQQKHQSFVNRFNHTGQTFIINNKVTTFLKNRNGFVVPVEMFIKFHYSLDYQYTFIAIIKQVYEIAPFANGVKYHTDQLMFMIVENDVDGCITEYSATSVRILNNFGLVFQPQLATIQKRIFEVLVDLDFDHILQTREERLFTKEVYEQAHMMNISQFMELSKVGKSFFQAFGSGRRNHYQSNSSMNLVPVKIRIFEEHYSAGNLDMNIFCFLFISDDNKHQYNAVIKGQFGKIISTAHQNGVSLRQQLTASDCDNILQGRERKTFNKAEEEEKIKQEQERADIMMGEGEDSSCSGSQSSGASTSGSALMAEFRNYDGVANQKTPRTLSIITKLIILLYLIMMGIASINLGINITKQQESELDINTVKQAYDRMNFLAVNLVLMRVLLNVANGYEPNVSPMSADRFWRYQTLQEESIINFKQTQALIQQSKFSKSEVFTQFEATQNVPLNYLGEDNSAYTSNEFLNVAYNSYIAKLIEASKYTEEQLKGNIGVQKLNGFKDGEKYHPTHEEQILYFIAQNGILPLRRSTIDACFLYAREAEAHAESSIQTTLFTAIISIISIIVIGIILSPLMTTAETRRFHAISFFLKIPKSSLQILINKADHYCMHLKEEESYSMIQREYERIIGIKLINQQVDQLREAETQQFFERGQSHRFNEAEAMASSPPSSYGNSYDLLQQEKSSQRSGYSLRASNLSTIRQMEQFSAINPSNIDISQKSNHAQLFTVVNQMNGYNSVHHVLAADSTNMNKGVFQSQKSLKSSQISQSFVSQMNKQKPHTIKTVLEGGAVNKLKQGDIMNSQENQAEDKDIEVAQMPKANQNKNRSTFLKHDSENSARLEEQDSTRKLQGKKKKSTQSLNKEASITSSVMTLQEKCQGLNVEEIQLEAEALALKHKVLKQSIFKKRIIMILAILSTITFLSTFFIISYFLSIRTFTTASDVIGALEIVYQKGACFDYSIAFLRASQIRNSSIMVRSAAASSFESTDSTYYSASDYYINFCSSKEQDYRRIRTTLPPFFEHAAYFIQEIESHDMCELIYLNSESSTLKEYYPLCKSALSGIMDQGISNAFSYMLTKLLRANLNFNQALDSQTRDEQFLKDQMRDPMMVEIIDIKSKVVNPVLDQLNINCTKSVIEYINQLLLNFLTAFVMFTVILTLSMFFLLLIGFRKMKRTMLDTNIVLRIIPFEQLPKEDCQEIKDFFKQ